jgi:aspartate kinase
MKGLEISIKEYISKIILENVPDKPGVGAEIFGALGVKGINVELVVNSPTSDGLGILSIIIDSGDLDKTIGLMDSIRESVGAGNYSIDNEKGIITVSHPSLNKKPGFAGMMFKILSSKGINIDLISTSFSSISCLIPKEFLKIAKSTLEQGLAAFD